MKKPKLTRWFPGHIKPVHVGVYQVDLLASCLCYQHWNGVFFGLYSATIGDALLREDKRSWAQHENWRGLSEKPS